MSEIKERLLTPGIVFVILAVAAHFSGVVSGRESDTPEPPEAKVVQAEIMGMSPGPVDSDRDAVPLYGLVPCVELKFNGRLELPPERDGSVRVFTLSEATVELELDRGEVKLGVYIVQRTGKVIGWDIRTLDEGPKRRLWKEDFLRARDEALAICEKGFV